VDKHVIRGRLRKLGEAGLPLDRQASIADGQAVGKIRAANLHHNANSCLTQPPFHHFPNSVRYTNQVKNTKVVVEIIRQKYASRTVSNDYSYIKAAKSFLTYREKNCRRGRLRPRQDNLEDVKGIRGQGVYNIFCATQKFVIIIK
jgi:hypothetical protein